MWTKDELDQVTAELRAMQPNMKAMGDALDIPDVPQMTVDGQRKAKRLSRLDDLVECAKFIEGASLVECKHIVNELIERVSELTGSASKLEDAAFALTDAIEYGEIDCDGREWKTCPCDKCQDIRSQHADNAYERERDRRMGL